MSIDKEIKEFIEKHKVTLFDDDDQQLNMSDKGHDIDDGMYFLGMRTDEVEYQLVMTKEKTIEVENGKILKNEALYKSMNYVLSKLDYFYEDMDEDTIVEAGNFRKEEDNKGNSCIVFDMVGESTISEYEEEDGGETSDGPDGWENDPRWQ